VKLCNSDFTPTVTIKNSTGPEVAGDPPTCAADRFIGTLSLTGNTAGVVLGGSQTSGNVVVNDNSGGPITVKGNTIKPGGLACTGNNPAPTNSGQTNTAAGGKTGQCAGL